MLLAELESALASELVSELVLGWALLCRHPSSDRLDPSDPSDRLDRLDPLDRFPRSYQSVESLLLYRVSEPESRRLLNLRL